MYRFNCIFEFKINTSKVIGAQVQKGDQISQVIINAYSCLLQAKKLKRAERFGLQT
jgi:hypothetical protein